MHISSKVPDERVSSVSFDDTYLIVDLRDGRRVSVPLAWFPRLRRATVAQLDNWEISSAGYGIHWEFLDEDLSVEGLLRGTPAPGYQSQANGLS